MKRLLTRSAMAAICFAMLGSGITQACDGRGRGGYVRAVYAAPVHAQPVFTRSFSRPEPHFPRNPAPPAFAHPLESQPGCTGPGFGEPSFPQPGFNEPGFPQPEFNEPGFNQPGFNDPGFNQSGFNDPGFNPSGSNDPRFNQPGFNDSRFNRPGIDQPRQNDPSFNRPGFNQTGVNQVSRPQNPGRFNNGVPGNGTVQPTTSFSQQPGNLNPNSPSFNGNIPNGNIPNGNIPNGNIPNGNIPNGNIPNGSISNRNLANGNVPSRFAQNGASQNGSTFTRQNSTGANSDANGGDIVNNGDSQQFSALQMLQNANSGTTNGEFANGDPSPNNGVADASIPEFAPAESAAVSDSNHVGQWAARVGNNAEIQLDLQQDGTFRWFANNNGKASSFAGRFIVNGDSMTLMREDQQQLSGSFAQNDSNSFVFKVASAQDSGLQFQRR